MSSLTTLEKSEELEKIDKMVLELLALEEVEEDLENQEHKVITKLLSQQLKPQKLLLNDFEVQYCILPQKNLFNKLCKFLKTSISLCKEIKNSPSYILKHHKNSKIILSFSLNISSFWSALILNLSTMQQSARNI